MGYLERLNRILVSGLLLLVFVQVGLLFFLKSLQDEAEFRLVKNTSKANLICGEGQFASENYWPVVDQNVKSQALCMGTGKGDDCSVSQIQWNRADQSKELHLISIMNPPPMNWESKEQGGVVKVRVKKSDKPQTLALVSRSPLQWNFEIEKGAKIEKVIVATPTTVWLEGIDAKIPIEYLPREKMCSYPYTWHDAFNPENEFRVLAGALQKITGLSLNSFQGAQSAKEFWISKADEKRQLASVTEPIVATEPVEAPLKWQRQAGSLVAEKYTWLSGAEKDSALILPPKTTQTLEVNAQDSVDLYAVVNGNLKVWDKIKKSFKNVEVSLGNPTVDEVQAVAWDTERQGLVVYNEQRGGEFFLYDLNKKTWNMLTRGFKYNLSSMVYDSELKKVVVLVSRGNYFTGLVTLEADAEKMTFQEFKNKLPFDKKRWRWSLKKLQEQWHVQVFSPSAIDGQNYRLI